jgi:nitrogen fixation NifU-like protein
MDADMYADELIEQYEHPHNNGVIKDADGEMHEHNPLCGDEITMYFSLKGNQISDIKFSGSGCVISMSTASKLTDFVKGMPLDKLEKMGVKDIIDLIGIDPGPARLKCATLSLRALKEAAFVYEHRAIDEETKKL